MCPCALPGFSTLPCALPDCSPYPSCCGLLPLLSLASTHTTCCQVLAIIGLFYHPSHYLSALPHHMLGCGDLDLSSVPLVLPLTFLPFEASFPHMALVSVGWRPDALIGDATHGCHLLALTQYLTAF
jgi:hypothetical protein